MRTLLPMSSKKRSSLERSMSTVPLAGSKRICDCPSRITVPGLIQTSRTRRSPQNVPFVDSRSRSTKPFSRATISKCVPETALSPSTRSQITLRPTVTRSRSITRSLPRSGPSATTRRALRSRRLVARSSTKMVVSAGFWFSVMRVSAIVFKVIVVSR